MNLNKVMIIGRLTQEPEVRTTPNGQQVSTFSVATNRVWVDQGGQKQEKTEFHNVVTWRKLAELVGKYLVKGQEVYIEGRLETRSWEGPDGAKKYRTEIVADKLEMGAKPGGYRGGQASSQPAQQVEENVDQSAPAQATSKPGDKKPAESATDKEEEINIEDIPF